MVCHHIHESYANELKGVSLKVNDKIPRIAKRYEDAFKAAGLEFHKTRPMRLLLTKMGTTPKQVATKDVVQRFEALCQIVNERLPKG